MGVLESSRKVLDFFVSKRVGTLGGTPAVVVVYHHQYRIGNCMSYSELFVMCRVAEHPLLLLYIVSSTILGTVCHVQSGGTPAIVVVYRHQYHVGNCLSYWELFVMYRVAGHPLAQNERCLHMFLLEPTIDKDYVPGKVRTT